MAGLIALIGLAIIFGFAAALVGKAMPRSSSRMGSESADPAWSLWKMGDGGSGESSHDCGHDGDGGCDGGGD